MQTNLISKSQAAQTIDLKSLIPPGESSVIIMHQGQRYLLRVTQSNKLILTK